MERKIYIIILIYPTILTRFRNYTHERKIIKFTIKKSAIWKMVPIFHYEMGTGEIDTVKFSSTVKLPM